MKTTTTATTSAHAALPAEDEPRNVAVEALQSHTLIRKARVAAGRVDFPLTASEAKALEALGLIRIIGIWS